jgi:hypothetical protein
VSESAADDTEENTAIKKATKQQMMTSDCFMVEPSRLADLGAAVPFSRLRNSANSRAPT